MTRGFRVLTSGRITTRRGAGLLAPLVVGIGLLVAGGPARAQMTQAQKDEVKLHYQRATRAYDLQKYQEAIDEYQKAYEISGDPPMLYNIAQAYRLADQPAEAVRYARRAAQLTHFQDPNTLLDLAEAHAGAGRFAEADTTASQALEAARTANPDLVTPIRMRREEIRVQAKQARK